jgi:serpin B
MATMWVRWIMLAMAAQVGGCGGASSPPPSQPPGAPGSSVPPAVAQAQAAGTSPPASIVAADNQLGLNLLDTLMAGPAPNVALSPTSIALVLQILYNGAQGPAQAAMAQTLQLGNLTPAEINSANAALEASLDGLNPQVQLTVANSLWMHGGGSGVESAFVQVNETYYGASLGNLDGPAGTVSGDPNAWVAAQTDGLITDILPPGTDLTRVVALVANAIYFKGAWSTAFDSAATQAAPFTLGSGSQVTCQMMHETGTFAYFKGADFQAVSLPYAQGRLEMLILLPDPGVNLATLLSGMSAGDLATVATGLQVMGGAIGLPRFKSSFQQSLVPALSALGMGPAFGGDFSGVFPGGTLSDVVHASLVEVDEQGTVAAAGTSGVVILAVLAPSFTMTMDHPFFYAIRDGATGTLLFVGVLRDPTQTS